MVGAVRPVAPRRRSVGGRRAVRWSGTALGAGVVVWSLVVVGAALAVPGNDSFAARLAESARDHGAGFVVTALEELRYRLGGPAVGGALSPAATRSLARDLPGPTGTAPSSGALPPLATPAGAPLPGEGVFRTVVRDHGRPAVELALVRPDSAHTSYLAGVAWMSGSLLRFVQHPGTLDPGHLSWWNEPPVLAGPDRTGLAATFNSGFKVKDAHGAYYADGHVVGTLRDGAASLVLHRDGRLDVGAWGRDVRTGPDVVAVRQNLDLLVDGGRVDPTAQRRAAWGATVHAADFVWRSGIGVTASGDVVYVAGDALSASTLGNLLVDAGAVRGMELDINPDWVSYMWYSGTGSARQPHKLVGFKRPADRYFTTNTRDFFAAYLR